MSEAPLYQDTTRAGPTVHGHGHGHEGALAIAQPSTFLLPRGHNRAMAERTTSPSDREQQRGLVSFIFLLLFLFFFLPLPHFAELLAASNFIIAEPERDLYSPTLPSPGLQTRPLEQDSRGLVQYAIYTYTSYVSQATIITSTIYASTYSSAGHNATRLTSKRQKALRDFLKKRTSYDVLPLSFRLIVLNTDLLVKKSLGILQQNGTRDPHPFLVLLHTCINVSLGIVSAPLWDSQTSTFAGLLTTADYINVVQYYWANPDQLDTIDQFRLSSLRGRIHLASTMILG